MVVRRNGSRHPPDAPLYAKPGCSDACRRANLAGICDLGFFWNLEFGVWDFGSRLADTEETRGARGKARIREIVKAWQNLAHLAERG